MFVFPWVLLGAIGHDLSSADPLPVSINWNGALGCLGAEGTESYVRRMVPGTKRTASQSDSQVSVSVQSAPDGKWEVTIATLTDGVGGERTLHVDSCDEARRAVALLVALMIDPNAQTQALDSAEGENSTSPEAAPPPTKPPPPTPPVPAVTLVETSNSHPSRTAPRGFIGISGIADYGTLPPPSFGAGLRAGASFGIWSLGVRASAFLPRSVHSSDSPEAVGKFALYDWAAFGCLGSRREGRITAQFCTGPSWFSMRAASSGVLEPGTATTIWMGLFAEGAAVVPLGHEIAMRLGLEGLIPFARPIFAIRDVGIIYQPKFAAVRTSLGLQMLF